MLVIGDEGIVHHQQAAGGQSGSRFGHELTRLGLVPVMQHVGEQHHVCRRPIDGEHVTAENVHALREAVLGDLLLHEGIHGRLLQHRAAQMRMRGDHRRGVDAGTAAHIEQTRFSDQMRRQRPRQMLAKHEPAAVHELREAPRELWVQHRRVPVLGVRFGLPVRGLAGAQHSQKTLHRRCLADRRVIRPEIPWRALHEVLAPARREVMRAV